MPKPRRVTDPMCIATINTGHFDFTAVGVNANDAKRVLLEGWMEHCNQYPDAERGLMTNLIAGGDVQFTFIGLGQCARDYEVISV